MDVVIAPHFDDAALSTAHVLVARRSEVTVLTVCAGVPAGDALAGWDDDCGFASGAHAARARAQEDLRANAVVGACSVHLGYTDSPYRSGFPAERVAADIAAALPASGEVWIPAGIGSHPDHVATRDVVMRLLAEEPARLRFYAECPYAFLPSWAAADAARDADHGWEAPLRQVERCIGAAHPRAVALDDDAMELKLAMLDAHGSQARALANEVPGLLDPDGPLRTELHWAAAPIAEAVLS
jgi:LmbE family N-acetylglucosaminyl deacetylase